MYAMRYGTLPVVRATGGLNDTVENFDEGTLGGTGFKFYDATAQALYDTIGWATHTFYNRPEAMRALVRRAMAKRFTWEAAAERYETLYRRAAQMRTVRNPPRDAGGPGALPRSRRAASGPAARRSSHDGFIDERFVEDRVRDGDPDPGPFLLAHRVRADQLEPVGGLLPADRTGSARVVLLDQGSARRAAALSSPSPCTSFPTPSWPAATG
jgi:hypothetical protein